jgi:hypothetical protein
MTKEEILNKHDSSRKYIEQTCRPELFSAMDEYAKQQAINFMKSEDARNNNLCSDKTYKEMYGQFIEQQNK